MKPILVAITLMMLASTTQARPAADQSGVCYHFQDNDLIRKAPCVVSAGSGAGGTYASFEIGGHEYVTESVEQATTLNGEPAREFARDSFFNEWQAGAPDEPAMFCYQATGSRDSYCHN